MLGQQNEDGRKEQAIYYLNKKFTELETRYMLVEKTCCALAWASKKLRQYKLYYTTCPGGNQRQAITDYLEDYLFEQRELMATDEDNHCRWKLYFDGAANAIGSGINFKIQHHNSAPYCPKMNGVVEAANKKVKKILTKMTKTYKDWYEQLPYALCAYRTSVRTSVGATPYSLVYGMEAVLPVEVEILSLRILLMSLNNKRYLVVRVRGCRSSGSLCFQKTM
uniref:Reverse transcriptase RNase H-like domain-containing protein n=1 Tax=Fagus sylvatica TaxID=28930 RepID=A0A2N9IMV0_FAGSY